MDLSIIVPTLPHRAATLSGLLAGIQPQISTLPPFVEVLVIGGEGPMGDKVQRGLAEAQGWWSVVVDDDDRLHPAYLTTVTERLQTRPELDVLGYRIAVRHNGQSTGQVVEHRHGGALPGSGGWGATRAICPKNVFRTDFGQQIGFGNHYTADQDWANAMFDLVVEADYIDATMYFYEMGDGYVFGGERKAIYHDYNPTWFRWLEL